MASPPHPGIWSSRRRGWCRWVRSLVCRPSAACWRPHFPPLRTRRRWRWRTKPEPPRRTAKRSAAPTDKQTCSLLNMLEHA
eukprot:6371213-Pyramimonas_sp.AAC.1